MTRENMAKLANAAARGARAGAPTLAADSARDRVISWLQWNDPNGSHTDARAEGEGFEPYTDAEAWEALAEMLAGAFSPEEIAALTGGGT